MKKTKLLAFLLAFCLVLPMFAVTSLADYLAVVAEKALSGDANDDGAVDTRDVITMRRYLADLDYDTGSSSIDISKNADMDNDGDVKLRDLYLLRYFIVNGEPDDGGEVGEGKVIAPTVPEDSWGYAFWNVFVDSIESNANISTKKVVSNILESEAGQALSFCDTMDMPEGYLPGFSQDITGFESATVFTPMASDYAFIGYVFELENTEDIPAFMLTLNEYHDLRWMICMTAEAVTMGAYDNYVLFIMSPVAMPDTVTKVETKIFPPKNVEDNTYAANIWNFFEEEMTFHPTVSAEGMAYAVAYSAAVPFYLPDVTVVATSATNAHFANGFDYVESIYSITEAGSDVVIYVFSIEQGLMADGWGSYYITGEDVVWGAYNNMLIAIHNGNIHCQ